MERSLVEEIRAQWSHAGVEVESVSGNKVRCRMPPYFQGVQEFAQSLEDYDATVDLETSMSSGAASVVFVVFAGAQPEHAGVQPNAPSALIHRNDKDIVLSIMVAMCILLQVASMVNWKELVSGLKKFI